LVWSGDKARELKDAFGTGVEALNPKKIVETIED